MHTNLFIFLLESTSQGLALCSFLPQALDLLLQSIHIILEPLHSCFPLIDITLLQQRTLDVRTQRGGVLAPTCVLSSCDRSLWMSLFSRSNSLSLPAMFPRQPFGVQVKHHHHHTITRSHAVLTFNSSSLPFTSP